VRSLVWRELWTAVRCAREVEAADVHMTFEGLLRCAQVVHGHGGRIRGDVSDWD
jgi:hypothetical protein